MVPTLNSREGSKHLHCLQLSPPVPRNRFYLGIHFHCIFKDKRLLELLAAGDPNIFSQTLALENSPPIIRKESQEMKE